MWLTGPTYFVQAISGAASSPVFEQLIISAPRFLFVKHVIYTRKCCDDGNLDLKILMKSHVHLPTYDSTALGDLGRFYSFLIYTQSVGLLERRISPSLGRYQNTEEGKQIKSTQTSMPRVGFEPMIPVFERAKTVHVLDRAVTVIGSHVYRAPEYEESCSDIPPACLNGCAPY
jgi:hypothetical protein